METTIKSTSLPKNHIETSSRPLLTGVITGQIAGLIMAVVVMLVFTLFLGKNPLYPVQVIGSMLFGEAALQGFHVGAFFAGLILHQLGPSLLWGVVYGVLAKKFSPQTTASALYLGLGVGVISMVGPYILIPTLMNALHGVDIWNREVPMFWDWAAHLVFGASFALYPTVAGFFKKS
ncbi:hypothetical protein [Bdellovibrio bacteriovorus]|uniref:hypothetical protein n=1 Tax=Bdellovibrio bacteriovorus TaxID=959 RepID=UPI0035A5A02C